MTTSHLAPVWFSVTGLPVVSGRGSWVRTTDGTEYLDFSAGIAVTSTGHCHPKVVAAIQEQAARFIHAQANVYRHDLLEPLAAKLAELAPGSIDTFFFANSGAEATEGAVKLAKQATGRPNVIVFSGSFHGRTHLAMAMTTSKTSYRAGYQPLPPGVFVAPFCGPEGDVGAALAGLDHLFKAQTAPAETAAVIMEPVLGEGGYLPAAPKFLRGVVDLCRRHGVLFVADEVQTGFARTGRMFAVEHYEVEPDIIVLAKGIASGFPFSAIGASQALMERWPTGSHGGTYGGNPMGCAAALATIEVLTEEGFLDHVQARSTQLFDGLRVLRDRHPIMTDVRGLGLMIGTQFATPAHVKTILEHCLTEGHVIMMNAGTDNDVIRWMPPLTVSAGEVDVALAAFDQAVKAARLTPTVPSNADLHGFTVAVTADRRGEEQAVMLRRLGADVVHAPVLRTLLVSEPEVLTTRTQEIIADPPDYLVANTGIGIRNWIGLAAERGLDEKLLEALTRTRIVARGPKADGALKIAGLEVWWRSPSEQLADVARHLLGEGVAGKRIAFQLHGDDSPTFTAELEAAGAQVSEVPVYRWTQTERPAAVVRLIEQCCQGRIDAVTFTAAPAVRNLFELADAEGQASALLAAFNDESGMLAACIGPVCAAAALDEGIKSPLTPEHWRLGSLVRLVGRELASRSPRP